MKLTATLRLDDDDRLFAELTGHDTEGDVCAVITDDGDLRREFRAQLREWAAANGHEIVKFNAEGLR